MPTIEYYPGKQKEISEAEAQKLIKFGFVELDENRDIYVITEFVKDLNTAIKKAS